MRNIDIQLTQNELEDFVLKLPPTELWLLEGQCFDHYYYGVDNTQYYNQFMSILIPNIPCIYHTINNVPGKEEALITYWTPSLTLVNFLLEKISSPSIQMCPIFGVIGTDNLKLLHTNGKHPCALYAPDVKSNLINVHKYLPGPFTVFWHDIGHTIWGNMLTSEQRHTLFHEYIPQFDALNLMVDNHEDPQSSRMISKTINDLSDLDLTPIEEHAKNATRLKNYVTNRTIKLFKWRDSEESNLMVPIGAEANDAIAFLMLQYSYRQPNPENSLKLWRLSLLDAYKSCRNSKIFTALKSLAKNSITPKPLNFEVCQQNLNDLQLNSWLELIDSDMPSKAVWEKAQSTPLHLSLLTFIINYHLTFFHPYLPLTRDKRLEFKSLLQHLKQIRDNQFKNEDRAEIYKIKSEMDTNLRTTF